MGRGNHYETLGVSPAASAAQIEQAYQFFAAMYEDESVATYSLLDPEEMREARARIRQAYEILSDAGQRREYDARLSAGEPLVAVKPVAVRPPSPPPPPEASRPEPVAPRVLAEPVTGESLRRTREELGIPLSQIAGATKVGVRYLEYIEADRHKDLPALVYLRGFVQEYARFLGLEPRRTAESYLKRVPPAE
jgi:flagellar biosynthesis protein FlhG